VGSATRQSRAGHSEYEEKMTMTLPTYIAKCENIARTHEDLPDALTGAATSRVDFASTPENVVVTRTLLSLRDTAAALDDLWTRVEVEKRGGVAIAVAEASHSVHRALSSLANAITSEASSEHRERTAQNAQSTSPIVDSPHGAQSLPARERDCSWTAGLSEAVR
jgi:hypothetical protein